MSSCFAQYNMAADVERREALSTLLARTAGAEAEEAATLAEAAEVETRRRAEVDAARAAGLPLPAFCRPAGRFPELRICMEDVDVTEDPGGASRCALPVCVVCPHRCLC
jgi:hypothetical protein